jgi:hypothetical protein
MICNAANDIGILQALTIFFGLVTILSLMVTFTVYDTCQLKQGENRRLRKSLGCAVDVLQNIALSEHLPSGTLSAIAQTAFNATTQQGDHK